MDKVRFLSRRQVEELTSLSDRTLGRLVADGKFPRPIRLSGGRIGYVESEVIAWNQARLKEARGASDEAQAAGGLTAPGILEKIVKIVVSYVDIPKALAFDIAIEIRDTIEADRLSAGKLQDC